MHPIWSDWFGIRHPLICAPMGGVAGGRLASAVSEAGALGMVGMGSAGSPEALSRELELIPTGIHFGIGMVDWVMRSKPDMLEIALSARPVVLSVSFGEDFDWVARARDAGIRTVTQVHDLASTHRATAAGIDILVARGREGGGHGKPTNDLDDLLPHVIEATDKPVLAAGAIATAEDVIRAIETGADGVWVGTAFAACNESLLSDADKLALQRGTETILTSKFDQQSGYAWPSDIPERVLADEPTSINAGRGVRHLAAQRSAREVVESLMSGAG